MSEYFESLPGELLAWMIHRRRQLHAIPEVGVSLPRTHEFLEAELNGVGLVPEVHAGKGLTVRIPGSEGADVVRVLRADMDALPICEPPGLVFASKHAGAMHACGHDLHMAMLLGVAKVLSERQPRHDVVLVFQPGEEADHGALKTLEHRNLQLAGDVTAFAIHVHAMLPPHQVNYRHGTFMAFGDWLSVTFEGDGGHASAPALTGSPVKALSQFVLELETLVGSLRDIEDVVGTVTEIATGNSVNVIPKAGSLRGTLRTLSKNQRAVLHQRVDKLVSEVAIASRTRGNLVITEGYPAVVSHRDYLQSLVLRLEQSSLAPHLNSMSKPSMVIEDFAYFLRRWPGAMMYLGAKTPEGTAFNHSPDVQFAEEVMTTGVSLHLLAADIDMATD